MFSEPQTLTVNAVAKNLRRVSMGDRKGAFELQDGTTKYALQISHELKNRSRRLVKFLTTKTAADPLLDGVSREYPMNCQLIIDTPKVGYSATEVGQIVQALVDWLDVPANLAAFVGGES